MAPAHTMRVTLELVRTVFTNRLISRFGDATWAPRSPDWTPLDFIFWGYIEGKVYIKGLHDLDELKENIFNEIRNLTPDI